MKNPHSLIGIHQRQRDQSHEDCVNHRWGRCYSTSILVDWTLNSFGMSNDSACGHFKKVPTARIIDFLTTTWNYFEILSTVYYTFSLFTQHLKRILALRARFDLAYLSVTRTAILLRRLATLCQRDECKMLTIGKEAEATHSFLLVSNRRAHLKFSAMNKAFDCRNTRLHLQESRKEAKREARTTVRGARRSKS
jgi:hypothetical protein